MKTLLKLAAVAVLAYAVPALASDQRPAPTQEKPILLSGADIYTVSGEIIRAGQLLFENGKITAIGTNLSAPGNAERIDCAGKRVYPGLIDADSQIGLTEIDSVRATRDQSETGTVNPNARAEVAINPDSELIPVARANGVLLAIVSPSGGTVSGNCALVQLDGWTWEEMTLRAPVGIRASWPRMSPARAWFIRQREQEQSQRRDEALKTLKQTFDDARAYLATKKAHEASGASVPFPDFDARWEAMIPLLERKTPLIVEASDLQQIQSVVAFATKENVRLIIVGGQDAPRCADVLKKHDVPVILDGVHKLPQRRGDAYDDAFTVPARLKEAGVKFAIAATRSAAHSRNLPYHAATAAAFGLSPDDALKSITLWPAEIIGSADRVGSLEVGKDATLFVCDGDILETPTQVERTYIQGRQIDLSSKHTRLWDKYKEKYRRLGIKN